MNRGSNSKSHNPSWFLKRFNEAPIHESGKYRGFSTKSLNIILLQ